MMELHRTFAALTLMFGCAVAEAQQIAVRVRTEKLTNPLGEPVFVLVELTNISSRTVQFADDGTCAQSFKAVFPLEHRMADRLYGCAGGGIAGSCGGSFVDLKAGESVVGRYLLPDRLEPGYAGDFNYTLQHSAKADQVLREGRFSQDGGFGGGQRDLRCSPRAGEPSSHGGRLCPSARRPAIDRPPEALAGAHGNHGASARFLRARRSQTFARSPNDER